ncbi:MAG: hypothetical protein NTU41_12405 [Chloroflexi bacterium]|nr:hypothetical protein [Chloroflexota bacterium]
MSCRQNGDTVKYRVGMVVASSPLRELSQCAVKEETAAYVPPSVATLAWGGRGNPLKAMAAL